ncbi:MAG: hypothetical protein KF787_11030 [Phycisphaeraceae bacterium]|nr:hypothetical protein [Phycisphaeraceae bacterium]
MKTVADKLADDCVALKAMLRDLIENHSALKHWEDDPHSSVVVIGAQNDWQPLSVDGRRLQSRLVQEHKHYFAVLAVLVSGLTEDAKSELREHEERVRAIIEQTRSEWEGSKSKVLKDGLDALDASQALLSRLYSTEGEWLVVPDTNALIAAPNVEGWGFEGADRFTLVLTPTVLKELDGLKVGGRNEDLRNKIKSITNRLKEYLRRGDAAVGVPIVRDRIMLRSVATEPRVEQSLPWLDSSNADDRFLASVIEIMRQHVRSRVGIVSEDINMLNKANLARIPVWEPPTVAVAEGGA